VKYTVGLFKLLGHHRHIWAARVPMPSCSVSAALYTEYLELHFVGLLLQQYMSP